MRKGITMFITKSKLLSFSRILRYKLFSCYKLKLYITTMTMITILQMLLSGPKIDETVIGNNDARTNTSNFGNGLTSGPINVSNINRYHIELIDFI